MSIVGLFGPPFGMFGDPRALSEKEIADRQIQQYREAMNAKPFDYRLLQNYRPPVHIPQGWVDWVAIGDELH